VAGAVLNLDPAWHDPTWAIDWWNGPDVDYQKLMADTTALWTNGQAFYQAKLRPALPPAWAMELLCCARLVLTVAACLWVAFAPALTAIADDSRPPHLAPNATLGSMIGSGPIDGSDVASTAVSTRMALCALAIASIFEYCWTDHSQLLEAIEDVRNGVLMKRFFTTPALMAAQAGMAHLVNLNNIPAPVLPNPGPTPAPTPLQTPGPTPGPTPAPTPAQAPAQAPAHAPAHAPAQAPPGLTDFDRANAGVGLPMRFTDNTPSELAVTDYVIIVVGWVGTGKTAFIRTLLGFAVDEKQNLLPCEHQTTTRGPTITCWQQLADGAKVFIIDMPGLDPNLNPNAHNPGYTDWAGNLLTQMGNLGGRLNRIVIPVPGYVATNNQGLHRMRELLEPIREWRQGVAALQLPLWDDMMDIVSFFYSFKEDSVLLATCSKTMHAWYSPMHAWYSPCRKGRPALQRGFRLL